MLSINKSNVTSILNRFEMQQVQNAIIWNPIESVDIEGDIKGINLIDTCSLQFGASINLTVHQFIQMNLRANYIRSFCDNSKEKVTL